MAKAVFSTEVTGALRHIASKKVLLSQSAWKIIPIQALKVLRKQRILKVKTTIQKRQPINLRSTKHIRVYQWTEIRIIGPLLLRKQASIKSVQPK